MVRYGVKLFLNEDILSNLVKIFYVCQFWGILNGYKRKFVENSFFYLVKFCRKIFYQNKR